MPQNYNPFAQQTAFASSAFMHQDLTYELMDRSEELPMDQMTVPGTQPRNVTMPGVRFSDQIEVSSEESGEK
jgi:hypothetical protein